jgi:Ni,Fe-hydrogenase I small subunit
MTNLWLQGGACSGNTMSFLNVEEPSVCDLVTDFGINLLWHPSLGMELGDDLKRILRAVVAGDVPLDIFVFAGTVIRAPDGTGEWNRFDGRPMQDWVRSLAHLARFTVAIGDCASWGGIPATPPNPTESTSLQFHKRDHGGFLGREYPSKAGLPVINMPGCPAHPDWITQILVASPPGSAARPRWTISSAPRPSSAASPRPAAPETCTSPTRSRRRSSGSAKAACSTTSGVAAR